MENQAVTGVLFYNSPALGSARGKTTSTKPACSRAAATKEQGNLAKRFLLGRSHHKSIAKDGIESGGHTFGKWK